MHIILMMRRGTFIIALIGVTILLVSLSGGLPSRGAAPVALHGWLILTWGDSPEGSVTEFALQTGTPGSGLTGEEVRLQMGATLPVSYETLLSLRDQPVTVTGDWQAATGEGTLVAQPGNASVFAVTAIRAESSAAAQPLAVIGARPWVTLLCKFADISTEPKSVSYFQGLYSSNWPGLDHYWREQSYNLMNVTGSATVSHWFTLPLPRSGYVYNMDADPELEFDRTRAVNDCTAAADAEVYFPTFVGINLMFNDNLDGYAWGGSRYLTLDGYFKLWNMTWEPPWGYSNMHVIAHEMGHGFGFPHSAWDPAEVYDNRWDIMSDGWSDCSNAMNPPYGCLAQQTITYHKDLAGWIGLKKVTINSGVLQAVTLEQLDLPQTANSLMVQIPIHGSSTNFYTLEVRRKVGYDVKLPGQGVIIHKVDTTQQIPARLVDEDNNGNTGDAGAMWTPEEMFTDNASGVIVRIDSSTSTGYVVTISNEAGAIPNPELDLKLFFPWMEK